jgi:hypothetical protein
MRQYLALFLLVALVFLSGCIGQSEKNLNFGLSTALTSDTKKAGALAPVTFILTIKNIASESAKDISAQLLNLTGWDVENDLQDLDELSSNDLYKFSWIAYAPPTPNKTFTASANIFYRMDTNAKLNIRVYDNSYLNTLKPEEKDKIIGKSALLSSDISKSTPIAVTISLQQPFILTGYSQRFPFVINIKNAGLGQAYSSDAFYLPRENEKSYVRFSYISNSSLACDYEDGDLVKLINGTKSIVCRLLVAQDDVNKYADFATDFTISYTYLDKASTKIEVV